MKLTPPETAAQQLRFENFCKKVLREESIDYEREMAHRSEHETVFSELPEHTVNNFAATDEYFAAEHTFDVSGETVAVRDSRLAKALGNLTQELCSIILLAYYLEMTDAEIGKKLNIVRSTIQSKRTSTLKELRKQMEENER